MRLFHGSPVEGLKVLKPECARDGEPKVYLSSNRPHATLYTVRSYLYPYGFSRETGLVKYGEPYPECLRDLYQGKRGYVYEVECQDEVEALPGIRYAYVSKKALNVLTCEKVDDAYRYLLDYHRQGLLEYLPYDSMPAKRLASYHKRMVKLILEGELLEKNTDWSRFVKEKFAASWKEAEEVRDRKSNHG